MRNIACTTFAAWSLVLPKVQGQQTLPYSTGFEQATAPAISFSTGSLAGQNGWSLYSGATGSATVVGSSGVGGGQCVQIAAVTPAASVKLPIVMPSGATVFYADFAIRMVAGTGSANQFADSSGAVLGFLKVNSDGELYAADGDGVGGGVWIPTGTKFPISTGDGDIATGWQKLIIRQDFTEKEWDLYARDSSGNVKLVAGGLGLMLASKVSADSFIIQGNTTRAVLLDDVTLSASVSWDTDQDGLIDAWEQSTGSSLSQVDRMGDNNGNGRTNLEDMAAVETYAWVPNRPPETVGWWGNLYSAWGAVRRAQRVVIPAIDGDLSGITWNATTGTYFGIKNGQGGQLWELSRGGQVIRTIRTSSVTGNTFDDPEAICWTTGDEYVIAEEKERKLIFVRIGDESYPARVPRRIDRTVTLAAASGSSSQFSTDLAASNNGGLEGICYRPAGSGSALFYGILEGDGAPGNSQQEFHVFQIAVGSMPSPGATSPAQWTATELTTLTGLLDNATDPWYVTDLSDIAYDPAGGLLYLLSDESRKIVVADPATQTIKQVLDLNPAAGFGAPHWPSGTRPEGIALIRSGSAEAVQEIAVVGEPNLFVRYAERIGIPATGPLVISELVAQNDTGLRDKDGKARDWFEIWNVSSAMVSTDQFTVRYGESSTGPWTYWRLPAETMRPGQRRVIFASEKDKVTSSGEWHSNFKLKAAGARLQLFKDVTNGLEAVGDELVYPSLGPDYSYGFVNDDSGTLNVLTRATPGGPNVAAASGGTPAIPLSPPSISPSSFFIGGTDTSVPVTITITDPNGVSGATTYYTLDGSEPYPQNPAAQAYTGTFQISSSTVVRAACTASTRTPSRSVARTYVVRSQVGTQGIPSGYPTATDNRKFSGGTATSSISYEVYSSLTQTEKDAVSASLLEAPAVAIVADPQDLFYLRDGIYANSSTAVDERKIAFEYYDPANSSAGVSALPAGVKVTGHASRYPDITSKHNLRLLFRDEYGAGSLNRSNLFSALPGESSVRSVFSRLQLRNPIQDTWAVSGQWASMRTNSKYFTDAWVARRMAELGYPAFHRRWAHVFINGIYWGVYEMMEHLDGDTVDSSFGEGKYDLLKSPELTSADGWDDGAVVGNWDGWLEVEANAQQLRQAAMAGQSEAAINTLYSGIAAKIDVNNLIDYILLHLWTAQEDWPHHNYLLIRRRLQTGETAGSGVADGKFRFLPWDAEWALRKAPTEASLSRLGIAAKTSNLPGGPAWLFEQLKYASDFRSTVQQRCTDLLTDSTGGDMATSDMLASFDSVKSAFSPLLAAESARWGWQYGTRCTSTTWDGSTSTVGSLAYTRATFFDSRDSWLLSAMNTSTTGYLALASSQAASWRTTPVTSSYSFVTSAPSGTIAESPLSDTDGDGISNAWETAGVTTIVAPSSSGAKVFTILKTWVVE